MTGDPARSVSAEVGALLEVLSANFPDLGGEVTNAAAARALLSAQRSRRDPAPIHRVADQWLPAADPDGTQRTVPVRVYWPHDRAGTPVVVFLHGGGFVLCGLDSHDGLCRDIATRGAAIVVSVDYRLAPEHPFPAGFDDAAAVLAWVAGNAAALGGDPNRVSVAGDSAGGNLAAALAVLARDEGGPAVHAQVLIYPMLDPAQDSASYRRFATGYFLTAEHLRWFWQCYRSAAPAGPVSAYLSPPATATGAGLAPALVVTAGCDPLHDEAVAYARLLQRDGTPVTLLDYPGLFHGFMGFCGQLSDAATAVEGVMAQLRRLLHRAPGRQPDRR